MKSLEQQAEKYALEKNEITGLGHYDQNEIRRQKCKESFLAGASAAIRLLSEKEGREVMVHEFELNGKPQLGFAYSPNDLLPEGRTWIKFTEAAPLRARVLVLEEECDKFRKGWMDEITEKAKIAGTLMGAEAELEKYKMPPFTSAGKTIRHYQEENAKLKAKLKELGGLDDL